MSIPCETFLEQLAAECAAERPWNASLEAHLAACQACAQRAEQQRAALDAVRGLAPVGAPSSLDELVEASFGAPSREQRVLGRLSALERVAAPADLEGRVVAASLPGYREDRAVAELSAVSGPGAPTELDGRLEGLFSSLREEGLLAAAGAPTQLAERVDQDLQDPAAALAGQMLTKLPRVEAPGLLEARVEGLESARPALRLIGSRPVLAIGLAAAAALVLLVGLPGMDGILTPNRAPGPEALVLDFEVEHPSELDALSPRGRELYARLSGGLALGGPSRIALETDSGSAVSAQQRAELDGSSGGTGTGSAVSGANGTSSSAAGGAQSSTMSGGPAGAGTNANSSSAQLGGGFSGPDYFQRLASAPFETAYRGDRVVKVRTMTGDIVHVLEYVEDVAANGHGAFTVVPIQVLDPILSFAENAEYLMRQEAREGFFYRYRDFRIRDFAAFQLNYEVQDLGQSEVIAGVPCELFDIQRRDGTGDLHRVAIDPVTALVLSEVTTRPNGEVLHQMRYQTFALDADLSDLELNSGVSAWTTTDQSGLGAALQNELLLPTAPPSSYELQSFAYRATAGLDNKPWAQLTYGDGVDTAFFLFEDSAVNTVGNAGPQHQVGAFDDVVRAYTFGTWTMIEGEVRGRKVLAVGKVQEQELLLMLQSAVE